MDSTRSLPFDLAPDAPTNGHPETAYRVPTAPLASELTDRPSWRLKLLSLPETKEHPAVFWPCLVIAIGLAICFAFFLRAHYAPGPGNPGIDENVYLVAGKNLATNFTTGFKPESPYEYISPMWVMAEDGWYYPKYPAGVPLLNAIILWSTGHNTQLVFLTSPICATLAVLGMFFLTRVLVGSIMGLLAMAALACTPSMQVLALVPSSHAPAICFAIWGMYALVCWMKNGRLLVGILAGVLIGFTTTMRYSEGLLGLPLGIAALSMIRWGDWRSHFRTTPKIIAWAWPLFVLGLGMLLWISLSARFADFRANWSKVWWILPTALAITIGFVASIRWTEWRQYLRAAVPVLAWMVPVLALLIFNKVASGHWTGYGPTNEDGGFGSDWFKAKWEFTIQQLVMYGLFFILPLGVAGMLMMFGWSWRVALVMLLWFVPSTLLYIAYYWGGGMAGIGYLRFFLTVFPPVIVAALWMVGTVARAMRDRARVVGGWPTLSSVTSYGMATVFIAAVCAVGIYSTRPSLRRLYVHNANLAFTSKSFLDAVPAAKYAKGQPTPVVFCEEGGMFSKLLMHLQFVGEGDWFAMNAVTTTGNTGRWMGGGGGRRPGGNNQPGGNAQPGGNNQPGGVGPGGGAGGNAPAANEDPTPVLVQRERIDKAKKLYEGKTTTQMAAEEAALINQAIADGRPVYAVLAPGSVTDFSRRLGREGFDVKEIAGWKEPFEIPADLSPAPTGWFGRGGQRGGGGAGGGGGRPGGFGQGNTNSLLLPGNRIPSDGGGMTLNVMRITAKVPTTAPTTQPQRVATAE